MKYHSQRPQIRRLNSFFRSDAVVVFDNPAEET